MVNKALLVLTIFCLSSQTILAQTNKLVCYYGSWANYRPDAGKFTSNDIDPNLCTHIIYTFLGLDGDTGALKILDSWLDIDLGNMANFTALKGINPNLKALVAVGGWNEGSQKYSGMAGDPAKRATLINSAIDMLQTHGFDGLDIDWEYPCQRGGVPEDKENLVTLLSEIRTTFDQHGYLLTMAVGATQASADLSYDIPGISQYLDHIHVMAYDMHGSWEQVTGIHSPLYPAANDLTDAQKSLSVDSAIQFWLSRGADPRKIILGVATYGRSFTLADPNNHGIGDIAYSAGNAGPYTREAGDLGYNEICEFQKEGGWTVVFDDNTQTNYAYKGDQWVGYDTEESIALKAEYAKSLNLGGVMVWSLETDDFRANCGSKNPLISKVKETLGI